MRKFFKLFFREQREKKTRLFRQLQHKRVKQTTSLLSKHENAKTRIKKTRTFRYILSIPLTIKSDFFFEPFFF